MDTAAQSGETKRAAQQAAGWLSGEDYAKLSREDRDALKADRYRAATLEGLKKDYEDALRAMPSTGRHNYIAQAVVVAAKRASLALGLTCEGFVADCIAAGGSPQLSESELRGIWEWSDVEPVRVEGLVAPVSHKRREPPPKPRPPSEEERGYVRAMIAAGNDVLAGWDGKPSELIRAASQIDIPPEPERQAAVQLRAVFDGLPGMPWAGERKEAGDAANVQPWAVFADKWARGAPIPSLVSVNPHTGSAFEMKRSNGELYLSFRCARSVALWRFALVEFDGLPLADQAAFWLGVLSTRSLDVRTLVDSGHKSIHGVCRVWAVDAEAWKRLWGKVRFTDGRRDEEKTTWGALSRRLLSDREAVEKTGADGKAKFVYPFCADEGAASVLTTRLAGCGPHTERKTDGRLVKYRRAHLLWAAKPDTAPPPEADAGGRAAVVIQAADGAETAVECKPQPATQTQTQAKPQGYARRCTDCPPFVSAVCRRSFGKYWLDKSDGGDGCGNPVDALAEARKAEGYTLNEEGVLIAP